MDSSLSQKSLLDGLVRIASGVYRTLTAALRRSSLAGEAPPAARKRRRPRRCVANVARAAGAMRTERTSRAPTPLTRPLRRLTGCPFAVIGCGWRGPAHEAHAHEAQCAHPHKSAADVVPVLAERDAQQGQASAVYTQLFELFSYEKITINGG